MYLYQDHAFLEVHSLFPVKKMNILVKDVSKYYSLGFVVILIS